MICLYHDFKILLCFNDILEKKLDFNWTFKVIIRVIVIYNCLPGQKIKYRINARKN